LTHHFRLLREEDEDLIGGVVLFWDQNRQIVPAGHVAVGVAEGLERGVEVVLERRKRLVEKRRRRSRG